MANERLAAICIDLFSHFCNDQRQKKQALARSLAVDACLADCTINRGCQKKPGMCAARRAGSASARRFCDWRAGVKLVFIPFADSNVVCMFEVAAATQPVGILQYYSSDAWSEYENRSLTNVTTAVCHRAQSCALFVFMGPPA